MKKSRKNKKGDANFRILVAVVGTALVIFVGITFLYVTKDSTKPPSKPVVVAPPSRPTEPHSDAPDPGFELQLFVLTNQDRQANGLKPLSYDNRLEESATKKCNDMVANKYFGHDRGQGTFIFFPMDYAAAGENLERGNYPPDTIERAFMMSPEHRANILGNYDSVGFASCGNGEFAVEHFILWPAIKKGL